MKGENVEVFAIHTGSLQTTKSKLFYRYESFGEPDREQSLDYFFWVVRAGSWVWMVDSGFDPRVGERRGRTNVLDPVEGLARLDISPDNVQRIVISHFHYDHIGNLNRFPHAELVVATREMEFFQGPIAKRHHFAEHVERDEIEFVMSAAAAGRVIQVEDNWRDGPIEALVLPGHSAGQMIIRVESQKNITLASDALHLFEELSHDRPFAVFSDLVGMYRTFETLRNLSESKETLVPGHDPKVREMFPMVVDHVYQVA